MPTIRQLRNLRVIKDPYHVLDVPILDQLPPRIGFIMTKDNTLYARRRYRALMAWFASSQDITQRRARLADELQERVLALLAVLGPPMTLALLRSIESACDALRDGFQMWHGSARRHFMASRGIFPTLRYKHESFDNGIMITRSSAMQAVTQLTTRLFCKLMSTFPWTALAEMSDRGELPRWIFDFFHAHLEKQLAVDTEELLHGPLLQP